jgi:predicted outer membrane repeat protein
MLLFFLQTLINNRLARVNVLSHTSNVSIISKLSRPLSFQFSRHPIFMRIPTSSFAKLSLKNIRIEKSSAPLLLSTANEETEISDSHFIGFKSENYTGTDISFDGIDIYARNSILTFRRCIFEDCGYYENSVIFDNCTVTFDRSVFTSCIGNQGVIYSISSVIEATKTNFSYNYVDGSGGVFCILFTNLTLNNCMFLRNQSPNSGGAIYGSSSYLKVFKTSFLHNQAGHAASAIELYHTNASILGAFFIRNFIADIGDLEEEAVGPEDDCCVVVLDDCEKVEIRSTRFVDNRAGPKLDYALKIIGKSNVKMTRLFFDQSYNDSVLLEASLNDEMPVVTYEMIFRTSYVPIRFKRIISETENHVRRIIVNVSANLSKIYISVIIAVTSLVIVGVLFTLGAIAGGF